MSVLPQNQKATSKQKKKKKNSTNSWTRLLQFATSKNKEISPYSGGVLVRKGDDPLWERWPLEMVETS